MSVARRTVRELPGNLDAPATARRLLRRWMGHDPRTESAVLALSEIVANAIKHGDRRVNDTGVTLTVTDRPSSVRVTVSHPGEAFALPDVSSDEARATGLGIVDRIVDRWGVQEVGSTVCVWFELRQPAPGSSATTAQGEHDDI